MRTTGRTAEPGVRYNVTRSWYAVIALPAAATNVSTETVPSASRCPDSDVRRMSSSPYAQRPRTYHFVCPAAWRPRISTCSQLPAGTSAVHEATSSVAANPTGRSGPVHRAYSQLFVPRASA